MSKPLFAAEDFDNIPHCAFASYTRAAVRDRANEIHDERCPATRRVKEIQGGNREYSASLVQEIVSLKDKIKRLWDEAVSVREVHHKEIAEVRAENERLRLDFDGRKYSEEAAVAEANRLRAKYDARATMTVELENVLRASQADNARLRKALEFYADKQEWIDFKEYGTASDGKRHRVDSHFDGDFGAVARVALEIKP